MTPGLGKLETPAGKAFVLVGRGPPGCLEGLNHGPLVAGPEEALYTDQVSAYRAPHTPRAVRASPVRCGLPPFSIFSFFLFLFFLFSFFCFRFSFVFFF
jgi:hypothetical protein